MQTKEVIETVHTMSEHVARLEQFVNSMNTAQKIADLKINRETVLAQIFICNLKKTATLLCNEKNLVCETVSSVETDTLNIDQSAVTHVFENLLSNALRFAKSKVSVQIERNNQMLSIRVADDGKGFSGKELVTAAKPYYSGRQETGTYHFGLGLYICRTLCEKHESDLKLANAENGGAVVTAVFAM